jgi:mRNA-degrading endonuclease toxin of MazEF toxin-antitoxin module
MGRSRLLPRSDRTVTDLPRRGEIWWCEPVPRRSAVNLDSVESVPVGLLVERIGILSGTRMRQICAALAVATDCRSC